MDSDSIRNSVALTAERKGLFDIPVTLVFGAVAVGVFVGFFFAVGTGGVTASSESQAQKTLEEAAREVEDFCTNQQASVATKVIPVPEGGKIDFRNGKALGWVRTGENGDFKKLETVDISCSRVEVSDPPLKKQKQRSLVKIGGTDGTAVRIE